MVNCTPVDVNCTPVDVNCTPVDVNCTPVDVNLCGARVCRHPVAVCINHCTGSHPAGRPLAK